ncbi:MAG TPA: lipoyl(octanoyl) transferase LipB [Candidatus Sulfomarinibacteraceae bacterium]|nr:lipoyl(octanoyl) transferase LipB [Candidatus Sulfomarinibacteraceae bacterium]
MMDVEWLGRIDYERAWSLQKELVAQRHAGNGKDRLLLLEHPPVYTMGRSGSERNLLIDERARQKEGIELYWVDRGGDVTYHGPGQLVGYPILDLRRLFRARGYERPDLHRYLRDVEELIIRALATFDVSGWRHDGYTGVWVDGPDGPRKIAAIGIKVSSRGISSHGFALNVDPNLAHFEGIVPCGIEEHGVTSLARMTGRSMAVTDVIPAVVAAAESVFDTRSRFVGPLLSAYNDV